MRPEQWGELKGLEELRRLHARGELVRPLESGTSRAMVVCAPLLPKSRPLPGGAPRIGSRKCGSS
jgi:hypothetical protein